MKYIPLKHLYQILYLWEDKNLILISLMYFVYKLFKVVNTILFQTSPTGGNDCYWFVPIVTNGYQATEVSMLDDICFHVSLSCLIGYYGNIKNIFGDLFLWKFQPREYMVPLISHIYIMYYLPYSRYFHSTHWTELINITLTWSRNKIFLRHGCKWNFTGSLTMEMYGLSHA